MTQLNDTSTDALLREAREALALIVQWDENDLALWEHHIARANSAIAKIDAHVSGPREIPPLPKTDAQSGVRRAMQVIEWHRNDYNGAIIDNLLNEIKNATGVELKTA